MILDCVEPNNLAQVAKKGRDFRGILSLSSFRSMYKCAHSKQPYQNETIGVRIPCLGFDWQSFL